MKKILLVLLLIFLAGISFAGGTFVAKIRLGNTTQKVIVNEPKKEEVKNVSESNVEITEAENPVISEVPAENKENEKETKFSFAVFGDTQYYKGEARGSYPIAAKNIKNLNPDFALGIGDLVPSCDGGAECENKFNAWKNVINPLKTYVVQGNHDRTGREKSDSVWEKVFSYLPDNGPEGFKKFAYSFDFENSHFVVLDSDKPNEHIINDTQRNWLEKDLAANTKENTFVFFHEPAYPTNSKIDESLDAKAGNRDALWNILVQHKITAVFSAHEHIQSRRKVNGLYQFVFGNLESFNHLPPKPGTAEYSYVGQAFGVVEVDGKEITVKTYSIQGKVLNSFTIPK